jgi:hypothetical protein
MIGIFVAATQVAKEQTKNSIQIIIRTHQSRHQELPTETLRDKEKVASVA